MSTATATTVTVTFDPTAINKQSDIIGPASLTKAGLMTPGQVRAVSTLPTIVNFPALTTDGSQTTIGVIPSAGDGPYQCKVDGAASDANGANAACFNALSFAFIVSGGVIIANSVPTQLAPNPSSGVGAAFVVDLVPNGDHVDVKVTGFAGTTVLWNVSVEVVSNRGPLSETPMMMF